MVGRSSRGMSRISAEEWPGGPSVGTAAVELA